MGTIVRFPKNKRRRVQAGRAVAPRSESATVIILPVVRIERSANGPIESANRTNRRRRRRRVSHT
jgi:hypothetical protein